MEMNCLNCGLCCYYPKNVGMSNNDGKVIIGEDGFCVHFTKGSGCDIYENRPYVCKIYPKGSQDCLWRIKNYQNTLDYKYK